MPRGAIQAWLLLAAVGLGAPDALARSRGIVAEGCHGCHGEEAAAVSASLAPASFAPGDEVILSIVIQNAQVGGVYVDSDGVGDFRVLEGEGLTEVSSGLTHSSPKPAQTGQVQFRVAWRAPSAPGSVRFTAYAVAGDDNARSSGDVAGTAVADAVFGCDAVELWRDSDGDGFGRGEPPLLKCAGSSVTGYAAAPGDCDDFRPEVHPGATELCDQRDNDCDQLIDEDAVPVELWPDPDGDGYHDRSGEPLLGCVGISGYAADWGDCAPQDPARHIGATEVCNRVDDNCDNLIDERTRPQCGIGWCRRESETCAPEYCTPGAPEPELCNGLDDDCDDETDEDASCSQGRTCIAGECIDQAAVPAAPDAGSGGTAGSAGTPSGGSAPKSGGCGLVPLTARQRSWAGFVALAALGAGAACRQRRRPARRR